MKETLENSDHEPGLVGHDAAVSSLGYLGVRVTEGVNDDSELAHAAQRFEMEGFAKETPRFEEQLTDDSRNNRFRYIANYKKGRNRADIQDGDVVVEATEHDGLNGLNSFLDHIIESGPVDAKGNRLAPLARDIKENLTFIGQKEYYEAASGIAAAWKAYLDVEPARQLCIVTGISKTTKGEEGRRKSDDYLLEKTLSFFSDEELEAYGDRLIGDPAKLTVEPEAARIILLDDWTISGQQLQHLAISTLRGDQRKYRNSLEINLIAASGERIENGLESSSGNYRLAPIKAYYRAHSSDMTVSGARITGTHSSVDHDFDDEIGLIVLNINHQDDPTMPPLTNTVREYRSTVSSVSVDEDGRFQRRHSLAA